MREGGIPPPPRVHRGAVVRAASDASWVSLGGDTDQKVKLSGAQRRMLHALITAHRIDATRALRVWDLLAAGWPGEHATHEASLNRVYVGLSRIRDKGLRDAIERYDDGWRFSPAVVLRIDAP